MAVPFFFFFLSAIMYRNFSPRLRPLHVGTSYSSGLDGGGEGSQLFHAITSQNYVQLI